MRPLQPSRAYRWRRLGIGTADAEANLRSLMAEQELRKDHLTLLEETAWHLVAA